MIDIRLEDKISDFKYKNSYGEVIDIKNLLEKNNLIIVYYPEELFKDNILDLQSYQEALPEIHKLNTNLVMITNGCKERIKERIEENILEYEILIDDERISTSTTLVVRSDGEIILSYLDYDNTNKLSPEEALDSLRNDKYRQN